MSNINTVYVKRGALFARTTGGGSKTIPYRKIEGRGPGVFSISGLGAHCWGPRAQFLHEECLKDKRSFVGMTWSGLDDERRDEQTGNYIVDNFSFSRYLYDAHDVFDQITEGPQIVVANSFGAMSAIDVAARNPSRVCGLVLVAPVTHLERHVLSPMLNLLEGARAIYRREKFVDYPIPPLEENRGKRFIRVRLKEIMRGQEFADARIKYDLNCPVVILHDPKDPIVPIRASEKLLGRMNSGYRRLVETEDAGHLQNRPVNYEAMWGQVMKFSVRAPS